MEVYKSTHTSDAFNFALSAVPSIGENGNWFIGEQDTGIFARGINVTGAEVGQTVKIAAVDENGVPTAWEAADVVNGDIWEKLNEFSLEENALSVLMDSDADGNGFRLKKMRVYMYLPKLKNTSGEDTNSGYAHYDVNNAGIASHQSPSRDWDNGNFTWLLEIVGNRLIVGCWKGDSITFHNQVYKRDFGGAITSFLWRVFGPNADKPSAMAGATFEVWGVRV